MNPCSIHDRRVLGAWCAAGALGLVLAVGAPGAPLFGNPQWRNMSDARAVACGDLDDDGDLDLVVANLTDRSISIFLTDASCELLHHSSMALGSQVDCVAVADVDADTYLDIVTAHAADNQVGVLLGDGDGTFADAVFYGADSPCRLTLTDLDGANGPDIVAANRYGSELQVLSNTGNGTFGAASGTPAGAAHLGVTSGDLDGDGWSDVVVCSPSTNEVVVLLNDQSGGFMTPTSILLDPPSEPNSVAIGDLDGDTDRDLAISCHGGSVVVAVNDGAGTFSILEQSPGVNGIPVTGQPEWIGAGDLDGDSDLDLVTATNADVASILLNAGDGTFAVLDEPNTTAGPVCVELADMDEDGDIDIVLAHDGGTGASILINPGNAGFRTFALTDTIDHAVGLALADVGEDANADLDAIVGSTGSQTFWVHPGDGAGGFGPPIEYATDSTIQDLLAADLDADNDVDLAMTMDNHDIVVFENDGSAGFTIAWLASTTYLPQSIRAGLLNADSAPDLAVRVGSEVVVFFNQGSCQFDSGHSFDSGETLSDIALGDFDADGDTDILAASVRSGLFRNDGADDFTDYTVIQVGDPAEDVAAHLATVWLSANPVLVNRATHTLVFITRNVVQGSEVFYADSYPTGPEPMHLNRAPLDAAIGEELLIADATDGSVYVYPFRLLPEFVGPTPYGVGPRPQTVAAGDMNSDGFLDLVANNGSGTVSDLSVILQIPPPCPGDLDGNGQTDVLDFSLFIGNFGAGPGATPAMGDLNGDGYVNVFDFAMFAINFGCGTS